MPPESNVESTLIWYKASDEGNVNYWTNEIETFLESNYTYTYDFGLCNFLLFNFTHVFL